MNTPKKKFAFAITTLAGARFGVFLRLTLKYGVEKKYFIKWALSGVVSLIVTLLMVFDRINFLFKKKPINQKPPVFVLGHWRSGTTLLHNLLCLDPESGYSTTYQTVFPNNLFAFKWLFKPIMKSLMPKSRPVDDVKLDVNYPQEEEFALNNEIPFSFYNWWYFPKKENEILDQYLLDKTTRAKDWKEWKRNYIRFVDRCQINTNGIRFISKNPPNTARIPQILELYPNAKFVFIHRNPYEVVRSTFAFYKSILPATQLQDIDETTLFADILTTYRLLMEKYKIDKMSIPKGSLMEVSYAELISDPEDTVQKLYTELLDDAYARVEQPIKAYLNKQRHTLKEYHFEEKYIESVNDSLLKIIVSQGYAKLG